MRYDIPRYIVEAKNTVRGCKYREYRDRSSNFRRRV